MKIIDNVANILVKVDPDLIPKPQPWIKDRVNEFIVKH